MVVFTGDEIDSPLKLTAKPTKAQLYLEGIFDILNNKKIEVYIVGGTPTHIGGYLDVYAEIYSNFHFLNEVYSIGNFFFIPELYDISRENILEKMKYETDDETIVFGHGTVNGFFISGGDNYESQHPNAPSFAVGDFANVKMTFFGHYHQHVVKDNFCYVGSVRSNTHAETGDKGVIEYNTDTNEIKRIIFKSTTKRIKIDGNMNYLELKALIDKPEPNVEYQVIVNEKIPDVKRRLISQAPNMRLKDTTPITEEVVEEEVLSFKDAKTTLDKLFLYDKEEILDKEYTQKLYKEYKKGSRNA